MAIIFRKGAFAVEAVTIGYKTIFRVCEYRGTESAVLDAFEGWGIAGGMREAIAQCKKRAEMGGESVMANPATVTKKAWMEMYGTPGSTEGTGWKGFSHPTRKEWAELWKAARTHFTRANVRRS